MSPNVAVTRVSKQELVMRSPTAVALTQQHFLAGYFSKLPLRYDSTCNRSDRLVAFGCCGGMHGGSFMRNSCQKGDWSANFHGRGTRFMNGELATIETCEREI